MIRRVQAFCFRAPAYRPIRSAMGTITTRAAVFVRVEDADGATGWGETWCNFPACGAEHRARLIETVVAPLLMERRFASPEDAFDALTRATRPVAVQAGEPGPMAQAIAGVDCALWDLAARRAGVPLWRALGGASGGPMPVYASALDVEAPLAAAQRAWAAGHRAFKLKIGFDAALDRRNLKALREGLEGRAQILVDANQAWSAGQAPVAIAAIAPFGLTFVEEPIAAGAPAGDWVAVARASPVPLAAGENLSGEAAFAQLVRTQAVRHFQPDVAKWGGLTGARRVARRVIDAGLKVSPHYLGNAVGQLASLHLFAALGGPGLQEMDCNPNPLRDDVMELPKITDGSATLGDGPGLGAIPDLDAIARYRIAH